MTTRIMEARAIISARDATGRVFQQIAGKMRGLDRTSAALNHRMASTSVAMGTMFAGAARFIAPAAIAYGAKKSVDNFAQLETAVTKLGITADATDREIAGAMETFRRQGAPLGATAKDMADAAQVFSAAGLDFRTAVAAVPGTVKAAKAAGGEINDLSGAGVAAIQQFGFTAESLERAFEIMAQGGKLGRVELKDMARLMPLAGAGAKRLGLNSEQGLAKTVAALEIIRESVGTAEEAATIWQNVVQKTFGSETQKNFQKIGVNLERSIKTGAKKGKDALDVLLDETWKLTKGDPFKIAKLFPDQQAQLGIQTLLQQRQKFVETTGRIMKESSGVIQRDYERMAKTTEETFNRLGASFDRAIGRIGDSLAPAAGELADTLTQAIDKIDKGETLLERIRLAQRERDLAAGRDPDATSKAVEEQISGSQETKDFWREQFFGDKNKTMFDWLFPSKEDIDAAVKEARERGYAERREATGDLMTDLNRSTEIQASDNPFKFGGKKRVYSLDSRLDANQRAVDLQVQLEAGRIALEEVNRKLARTDGGTFTVDPEGKNRNLWFSGPSPMALPMTAPGSSSFALSASGLPGTTLPPSSAPSPSGLPGAALPSPSAPSPSGLLGSEIEAVITKPVPVEGEVKGEVTVKNVVEPGSELLRVVEEAKEATAAVRGALRQQNGPGSTGVSSPDAGAAKPGGF